TIAPISSTTTRTIQLAPPVLLSYVIFEATVCIKSINASPNEIIPCFILLASCYISHLNNPLPDFSSNRIVFPFIVIRKCNEKRDNNNRRQQPKDYTNRRYVQQSRCPQHSKSRNCSNRARKHPCHSFHHLMHVQLWPAYPVN